MWTTAAAAVLALSVVEAGLRIADTRSEMATAFRMDDERRGWALRPGFAGWVTAENKVWVQINSDGLRDRERRREKPAGTIRVAVLGDSYIQAVNVPIEKAFTSFLETRLASCAQPLGRQAEVINFGVSGYGTAQELLTYRHHAAAYHPDIVVLAMYLGNDIFNNSRELNESDGHAVPYFVLRDGKLVADTREVEDTTAATLPWYHRVRMSVTERFITAKLVYNGYALLRAPFVPLQVVEVAPPSASEASDLVYQPEPGQAADEAWRVTEALVRELADEVAANGSELWVVTLSTAEQVHPDLSVRRAFAQLVGVDSLFYPDHRIRDFAQAHGIPVVSLAEPLADYAATNHVFLNGGYNAEFPGGTGHWNETAHRLAAGLVGERLCADSRAIAALK